MKHRTRQVVPLLTIQLGVFRSSYSNQDILTLLLPSISIERATSPTDKPDDVVFEGVLSRKHEWETTTKKASHRSWEKGLYVVLRKSELVVFKDQKHYTTEPTKTYRAEAPADLKGAVAAVPSDYTKRKNVFRLKLANGAEYLFEAKSPVCFYRLVFSDSNTHADIWRMKQEELNTWMGKVSAAITEQSAQSPGAASRSQTLPARGAQEPAEAEARKKERAKKTKTMLPA